MSERKVIHGAVMAECFHPGFGGLDADLLTDQEPRTGQVAVAVLKAEDYAALTAERDKLRHILEALAGESWEGMDIEVEFFQGLLLREGVFVEVPASEGIQAEYDTDTMYQLAWRVDP